MLFQIVPLSQRSGVLEWCQNTQPLSSYLINAHRRYYPEDFPVKHCRELVRVSTCREMRHECLVCRFNCKDDFKVLVMVAVAVIVVVVIKKNAKHVC